MGLPGLLALAAGTEHLPAELSPDAIYRQAVLAIATLEVTPTRGDKAIGTAFLALEADLAVTAWHLVREARTVTARFADGLTCAVIGVLDWDEVKDVALARLAAGPRVLSRLCLTNPPAGTRAYVIGAPKGYEFSFSDGLISQVRMVDGFAQYQTTCPISPGNSGGPLLNARGEVLGVVSWSKNDAQNLNFATPAACLLSLNPRSPVIPWTQLPVELRTRRKALAARADPKRTRTAAAVNSEFHELRQVLRQSQGQPLTITVRNATEEHVFNVTLPPIASSNTARIEDRNGRSQNYRSSASISCR